MKREITIYQCDICKKEVEKSNLFTLMLPIPYYQLSDYFPIHSRTDQISVCKKDACEACARRISDILRPEFKEYGDYAYQGMRISWKDKEES